jgi:CxxC motif-containing protein
MLDLRKTIEPKSDQLNADDLVGGPKTIRVTKVTGGESEEQPISIHYDGDNGKPYKPCKTMRRLLVQVWGFDGEQYPGRLMTLYRDDSVKFAGVAIGGIRISHVSHIDKPTEVLITVAKSKRRPTTIYPLVTEKTKKKDFTTNGYDNAVKAVIKGDVKAVDVINKYNVTEDQEKQLKEAQKEFEKMKGGNDE